MSSSPTRLIFTFDVDARLPGGGDTLVVVSLAAELRVLVHTCKWHVETVSMAPTAQMAETLLIYLAETDRTKETKNLAGWLVELFMKFKLTSQNCKGEI